MDISYNESSAFICLKLLLFVFVMTLFFTTFKSPAVSFIDNMYGYSEYCMQSAEHFFTNIFVEKSDFTFLPSGKLSEKLTIKKAMLNERATKTSANFEKAEEKGLTTVAMEKASEVTMEATNQYVKTYSGYTIDEMQDVLKDIQKPY